MKHQGIITLVVVLLFFSMLGACSNSGSNNMSNDYNTDANYRKNTDSVAKTYGTTSEEVDRKVQAVSDAMKKNR